MGFVQSFVCCDLTLKYVSCFQSIFFLSLNLLPLAYDREIKDLTFFYKAMHGLYDLDVLKFVSFVTHSRTRNCNNPSLLLKIPSCKTNTFKSSYFNRIVLLWNYVCKVALPSDFRSLSSFKNIFT